MHLFLMICMFNNKWLLRKKIIYSRIIFLLLPSLKWNYPDEDLKDPIELNVFEVDRYFSN